MADVNEAHPHAGSVWARIVGLWAEYVINESWTWATAASSLTMSAVTFKSIAVTVVTDSETINYNLAMVDTQGGGFPKEHPANYLTSRPGWFSRPGVLLPAYGARDTMDDFDSNMIAARNQITNQVTGNNPLFQQNYTDYGSVHFAYVSTWVMVLFSDSMFVTDWAQFQVWPDALGAVPYGGQGSSDPSPVVATGVTASTGGAVDSAGIIAAIEELQFVDADYTANNGGEIFSMRSKVRVGP